jgi:hypothetical protein
MSFSGIIEIDSAPVGFICFPAHTPVTTDQGVIPIKDVIAGKHTIRKRRIKHVTKTLGLDNTIVEIKKGALYPNVPSEDTIITRNHAIMINGKMTKAKDLVGYIGGVSEIPYTNYFLYNIVLDTHSYMLVNGMIAETLNPENAIAKLYDALVGVDKNEASAIIQLMNEHRRKTMCVNA